MRYVSKGFTQEMPPPKTFITQPLNNIRLAHHLGYLPIWVCLYTCTHLEQTVSLSFVTTCESVTMKVHCRGGFKELTSLPKRWAVLCLFLLMHRRSYDRSVSLLFINLQCSLFVLNLSITNNVLITSSHFPQHRNLLYIVQRLTQSNGWLLSQTLYLCFQWWPYIYPKYRCGLQQWLYTSKVTSAGPITRNKNNLTRSLESRRFLKTSSYMITKKWKYIKR